MWDWNGCQGQQWPFSCTVVLLRVPCSCREAMCWKMYFSRPTTVATVTTISICRNRKASMPCEYVRVSVSTTATTYSNKQSNPREFEGLIGLGYLSYKTCNIPLEWIIFLKYAAVDKSKHAAAVQTVCGDCGVTTETMQIPLQIWTTQTHRRAVKG